MKNAILLDFGSTHTKMVIASLDEERILHRTCHSSTVKTDARVGLELCLKEAKYILGNNNYHRAIKLSSSSAAGGLRMAVIGISKNLSVSAGRNTAFGAGAKILHTFNGKISDKDIESLIKDKVEILLFCGGYEKGNQSIPLYNANILAKSKLNIPIIYAGNSYVSKEIRYILMTGRKECYIVDNIIPKVGVINTNSAEEIVREVFLKRIINMKGLEKVKKQLDGILMPTPSAVLSAGELLSQGSNNEKGIGDLMIVDVGGATTDVHSYANEVPYKGSRIAGCVENYSKRTVESDLGLRESAALLVKEVGIEEISNSLGISKDGLKDSINLRVDQVEYIPTCNEELEIDNAMANYAVSISARRHAGYLEPVHSANCKFLQRGKNLSGVGFIIGTGGPIINSLNPKKILQKVLKTQDKDSNILLPEKAKTLLDKEYILYSMGLLREYNQDVAFRILRKNLVELS
ncbi:glutamate mutase L [Maledivibacter halophilus]|uniref:MutL protein n=1 Tax=Maledivibacter halophilus TaxID=36842 RepID=A0A1T5KKC1_9FIRM|nr:glutamate mutase L [Maledivibacter halophilus]SKC64192.1 conserved hypothetical protein [Maledivibacter halophilus]